ncbi:MAG: S-adenosylmethionine decarboxylase [Acidobacteriaceae bacterium]|nr:S-adenosylmethionine decarboxylase [Acidobacteriaceae bacterium]
MSGVEWVIEAHGCDPRALADPAKLHSLFEHLIQVMSLHPVAAANWHCFPGAGGVTGLQLLKESHLACHTFPEFGSLCLNVFCCVPRLQADFASMLTRDFGAGRVQVREIERPYES